VSFSTLNDVGSVHGEDVLFSKVAQNVNLWTYSLALIRFCFLHLIALVHSTTIFVSFSPVCTISHVTLCFPLVCIFSCYLLTYFCSGWHTVVPKSDWFSTRSFRSYFPCLDCWSALCERAGSWAFHCFVLLCELAYCTFQ